MSLATTLNNIEGLTLTDTCAYYGSPAPGLPLLTLDSPLCKAVICLQGAQLLEFIPAGGSPMLWLSPKTPFVAGKAIRGGIPLCAPWFGVHPTDNSKPNHGFVRNRQWQLSAASQSTESATSQSTESAASQSTESATSLTFTCTSDQQTLALYPYAFEMSLTMSLTKQVELQLQVTNLDQQPMPFSWALHSYFCVDDLAATRVSGLSGLDYIDNTRQLQQFPQSGDLVFSGEVDRFFNQAGTEQHLVSQPSLHLKGENCETVITWNPGETLAAKMPDIGADNYTDFVCVERGAAFDNSWLIEPGSKQTARLLLTQANSNPEK